MIEMPKGIAPLVSWDHTCGLRADCVYSGVPCHFVVKDIFSTLPIPICFDSYRNDVAKELYENQGSIFWPAGSNASNTESIEGALGTGRFRRIK